MVVGYGRLGAGLATLVVVALVAGCLKLPAHLLYTTRMVPEEGMLEDDRYYFDEVDSTTVFEHEGFRLKLRFLSDRELNEEYARFTYREPNLNPFTYGRDRDLDLGYTPPRFTVFEMTVVNQRYPKVLVDPGKMTVRTDRGDELEYWVVSKRDGERSFEEYYMERRGEGGNEEYYYQERMGLVREAMFRRQTFVFQGQSYSGKVVFAKLHKEVRELTVSIPDIVLRVDPFDRPKEAVDAEFRFRVKQEVVPREREER